MFSIFRFFSLIAEAVPSITLTRIVRVAERCVFPHISQQQSLPRDALKALDAVSGGRRPLRSRAQGLGALRPLRTTPCPATKAEGHAIRARHTDCASRSCHVVTSTENLITISIIWHRQYLFFYDGRRRITGSAFIKRECMSYKYREKIFILCRCPSSSPSTPHRWTL